MSDEKVKRRIEKLLTKRGALSSGELAEELGTTRQAAHSRLRRAVDEGWLERVGQGRAARYRAVVPGFRYPLAGSAEDRILEDVERKMPAVAALGGDEASLVRYAFTEMVNNALDHSEGTFVQIHPSVTKERVELVIEDDGMGAFERVRRARELASIVEAAAELTKGKVTSAPDRHSGEGVFFTSKAADRFELAANGYELVVDRAVGDLAIRETEPRKGTRVRVVFRRPIRRSLRQVFEEYTENYEFVRTRTVVRLFGLGLDFVSRSEARRLLTGLDRFREVVLDFEGVSGIGQGFADEVFRVFANAHLDVTLTPVNMNEAVAFFVKRALAARAR